MLDFGKTQIVGRLTKDVEIKTFNKKDGSGSFSKLQFTVAVNSFFGGEKHTEYYMCSAGESFVKLQNGQPHPATTMKKGDYVHVEAVKRERSYDEHISVEGIGPLYLPGNKPLLIKRYITEFHVHEIGLQPKTWNEGTSGQVYAQAAPANVPATNVVMGAGGAAPAPAMPPAAPAAVDAAAAGFAASNGIPSNM